MFGLRKVQWGVGLAVLALASLAPVGQASAGDCHRGRSYGFSFSYNSAPRCGTYYRPAYVYRDCGPRYVPSYSYYSYRSYRPSYSYSCGPRYSRGYSYGGGYYSGGYGRGYGYSRGHGGFHYGRGGRCR